jgi:hypothetical protein
MPSTGMGASYPLNEETINSEVKKNRIGSYVLGYINEKKGYIPKYVGRSDNDLNKRLKDWIENYSRFKFMYHSTTKQAYEKECNLYHDWIKQIDNKEHPDKPDGTNYKCPVCGQ